MGRIAIAETVAILNTWYEAGREHRFLLYETGSASIDAVQAIARAGYRVKSARADVSGILYEYEK
jgi:hypothetical protein